MKNIIFLVLILFLTSCGKTAPRPIEISIMASKYLVGSGVKKDVTKAVMLYGDACAKGHALSCGMVGKIYEDDLLKTQNKSNNLILAKKWYQMTCDKGEQSGCNAVQRVEALSSNDPCHMTLNSFIKHKNYVVKHDGHMSAGKTICDHLEKALLDGRKIQRICSKRIQRIRNYRGGVRQLLRTQKYGDCTEMRFN